MFQLEQNQLWRAPIGLIQFSVDNLTESFTSQVTNAIDRFFFIEDSPNRQTMDSTLYVTVKEHPVESIGTKPSGFLT